MEFTSEGRDKLLKIRIIKKMRERWAAYKIKILLSTEVKLANNLHLQREEYLSSCNHVNHLITIHIKI